MDCNLPGSSVHGDFPGKNSGMGCHALFQGIFPTQGLNPGFPHCRQILYHLSHQGSPRILEWVAWPFSRGSSWPRGQTRVSCIAGGFFTSWATREALGGEWTQVYVWLNPFAVHWKLSWHCLLIGYTPMQNKKFFKNKNDLELQKHNHCLMASHNCCKHPPGHYFSILNRYP